MAAPARSWDIKSIIGSEGHEILARRGFYGALDSDVAVALNARAIFEPIKSAFSSHPFEFREALIDAVRSEELIGQIADIIDGRALAEDFIARVLVCSDAFVDGHTMALLSMATDSDFCRQVLAFITLEVGVGQQPQFEYHGGAILTMVADTVWRHKTSENMRWHYVPGKGDDVASAMKNSNKHIEDTIVLLRRPMPYD